MDAQSIRLAFVRCRDMGVINPGVLPQPFANSLDTFIARIRNAWQHNTKFYFHFFHAFFLLIAASRQNETLPFKSLLRPY